MFKYSSTFRGVTVHSYQLNRGLLLAEDMLVSGVASITGLVLVEMVVHSFATTFSIITAGERNVCEECLPNMVSTFLTDCHSFPIIRAVTLTLH